MRSAAEAWAGAGLWAQCGAAAPLPEPAPSRPNLLCAALHREGGGRPLRRSALPPGAVFKAPGVASLPHRGFAPRSRTRVPDPGSGRQTSGWLHSEVGQDNRVRAPRGRVWSRGGVEVWSPVRGLGPGTLTAHLPASAFPLPAQFPEASGLGGPAAHRVGEAIGCSCGRESFAKAVSYRDALVVAMRSGAAAWRPLYARPAVFLYPPKRGSAGAWYRAAVGFAPPAWPGFCTAPLSVATLLTWARIQRLSSLPLPGVTKRGPGAIRILHAPTQPPNHTCRQAPLSPAQQALYLRVSGAAKLSRQGLRPLGKVVSRFTARGGELFYFF